ncbi:hypothetical protein B0T17DRAFT_47528 [Bombardia bombarda]|uniref:BRCT domain-containing protein n=1 Tax=Bombardia bombarda TaxID=252184 RepID=A0AA39XLM2_9PEZI|nr:hypothetical protein B0T17DRAFT_47528 [Bombardia bombarda]
MDFSLMSKLKPKPPTKTDPSSLVLDYEAEGMGGGRAFDPWNSVSAGHQRAETRGPPGWRESRNIKMNSQFKSGHTGGKRISDRVGAGSENFDQKHRMLVPKEVRARAMNSVADMLRNSGTMRPSGHPSSLSSSSSLLSYSEPPNVASSSSSSTSYRVEKGLNTATTTATTDIKVADYDDDDYNDHDDDTNSLALATTEQKTASDFSTTSSRHIFDGLVIYVNGSTHPLVSDHRLKHLFAEHGARMSLHLGRRKVTHVILGKPSGPNGGAGGGLAGTKLDKEIRRVGGCGVKYVGVEWVLESVKAAKRLPEARFANLKVAARGQQSVLNAFSKA